MILRRLDKFVSRVSSIMAAIGATLIGLLGLTVVADVIGRQIGFPVTGIVELAAQTVVASAFLTIPYVMRRGGHIRATVIVSRTPVKVKKVLETIAYLMGAVIFLLLAYSAFGAFVEDYLKASYEGEGALRIPTWPTRLVIFVASILMVIESLLSIVKVFVKVEEEVASE
jgi:TRAP-type C4-dicarboxylate transport system, small permease component